jgi:hypothetical protein
MSMMKRWMRGAATGLATLGLVTGAQGWQMKQAQLMTDWAQQVDPANLLPEYPRPQMVRSNWLNLNGIWQFQAGATNQAAPAGQTLSGEILVPFPMESAISGVQAYYPFSWYRRLFTVPSGWSGQRVILHLDAVDWESEVFINGASLGVHRGGYDPVSYDITSYLSGTGSQELIVRVYDPTDNGGQPRGKQTLYPGGIMYKSVSGIWQTVWLEPVPTIGISEIKLVPDIDNQRLSVGVTVSGSTSGVSVTAVARNGSAEVGRASGAAGSTLLVPVPSPKLWCPTNPFLYDLDIVLSNGATRLDSVASYFGMRKISVGMTNGFLKMLLNNQFVFQYGPLDQGFWPDGGYTAPTDFALKSDLEQEKAIGYNMVRKHIKVEPRRWYYWADKLGLLVWQDMPSANSYTGSPKTIDWTQFQTELTRMVQTHWNSPSIIMWVVFNEAQGQHDTSNLVSVVKALDPSRVVNQASGGDWKGVGDIIDSHNYSPPGYPTASNQVAVCGEFGGVGLGITNHTWASGWGYVGATDGDDLSARFETYSGMLADFAQNHGLCAGVYTEITDVETELNGFLTYDRKVFKPNLRRVQAAAVAPQGLYTFNPVVLSSELIGQSWKYTTAAPAANWYAPSFSDSSWSGGLGGFGTSGTPGAVIRTTWNTADIWLRRTFALGTLTTQQRKNLGLYIHHDEDAEVYINGVLAASISGYSSEYGFQKISDAARAALVPNGNNTFAVHCHQTSGGQYIDVGLSTRAVLVAPPAPPAPPAWVENGSGLLGEYFTGTNLSSLFLQRVDPTIDFNWGTAAPAPGLTNALLSVRWTGQIQPRYTEGYTFHLTSDNGRRLWINNKLIIDRWTNDWGVDYTGSLDLVGGQRYDIKVEYFNSGGGASAVLEWNSPSQKREVVPQGVLFAPVATAVLPASTNLPPTAVVTNRTPLLTAPYVALPLGSVRPQGWLLTQCQLQRDGLTGYAEQVYSADLGANSGWLGGTGESWERGPYYCKGLVDLAYVMNDAGLKLKAQKWMDWVLNNQRADGQIGPSTNSDWWPRMVATYALRDYYEATGDARVPTVLSNYFRYMLANLPASPMSEWGKARAGDQMDVALWLFNRNGDTNLLSLVSLLRQQAYDWTGIFTSNLFCNYGTDFHPKHNVNVVQALKTPAVYYQLSKAAVDRDALGLGFAHLMRENGLPCGINSGTEFVAGNSSIQGVELCSSVEAMLSLETAARILGDATLADKLETIAFNAFPAGLANNIKAHQYYTLPNNVIITNGTHGYNQDYANGTLPGPNSGFPCCRYNFHMGWPKYIQNSWAATPDGGLALMAYGPTVVNAMAGGAQVQISEETSYPFDDLVQLRVSVNSPVTFPLSVRIPAWCSNAVVTVNGQSCSGVAAGSFLRIQRTWTNSDLVSISLPMPVQAQTGPSRSVAVSRGPLVYSLQVGEKWTVRTTDPLGLGFDEFEVGPTSSWAYALKLNPASPGDSLTFTSYTTPTNPFAATLPSVQLQAQAQPLSDWTIGWRKTQAFEPPASPVAASGTLQSVTLVPFGAQHLRVSWFPYIGTPTPTRGSFKENFDSTWAQRWTTFGGNWMARNGSLSTVPGSANGAKALAMNTLFTNFTYEGDVQVGAVGNAGFLFRASKPDIGSDSYCGYYVGINAANGQVEIGWASNSWHSIATVPMAISANTYCHLKVQVADNRIRVFVNDTNQAIADLLDSRFAGGMVGVRDYCADGDRSFSSFSNLSVREFSTTTEEAPHAWYPFEGNANDASGNGFDGTAVGTVNYVAGKEGTQAVRFGGGSGNYVTVPLSVSNSFTIGLWVKTTATGGTSQWYNGKGLLDGEMAGAADDFGIALVGKYAAFGVGNSDTTILSTNAVNDGSWHHVVASRDSGSGLMSLYVDGVFQSSASGPSGAKDSPSDLKIGSLRTLVSGGFLAGAIDDVRIYERVLAATEVAALINHAPVLAAVFDGAILAGRTLLITNSAADLDAPGQTLSYSLLSAPAGAAINAASGLLTWRPTVAQAGQVYSFTVCVTDSATPAKSATQSFSVAVLPPGRPSLQSASVKQGRLTLQVSGDPGPDYSVYGTTNLAKRFADWDRLLTTNPATLPFQFTDASSSNYSARFYRVLLGP